MADVAITSMTAAGALSGIEPVEIAQLSATVAITATTISALASDNSFNDSANGFIAAGFAVNDRVYASGFTGDVANNIYVGKVTALTAGKMTIGGTDGDVIVNDAAGEAVTIKKWVTRRTTAQSIADLANTSSFGRTTLAKLTANVSRPDNDFSAFSWSSGQIVSDPLSAWSSGNPTRFTAPAGMTKARINVQAIWGSVALGSRWVYARVNANNSNQVLYDVRAAVNEGACAPQSPWITGLTPTSDFIDIVFAHNRGAALDLLGASGFASSTKVQIEWAA